MGELSSVKEPMAETDYKPPLDDIKLAAARLLLGEELFIKLVRDDWNTANSLMDPYGVPRKGLETHSANAVQFANRVLAALCEALQPEITKWGQYCQLEQGRLEEIEKRSYSVVEAVKLYESFPDPVLDIRPIDEVMADYDAEITRLIAISEGRLSDARFVSFADGQFDFSASIVPVIVENLAQMLSANKGDAEDPANYVEMEVIHPEMGYLTFHLQRKRGLTPHQCRKKAEEESEALKEQIVALKNKVAGLQERINATC